MPAPIPTDEALEVANAILSFLRERPGRTVTGPGGAQLREFQWPNMEEELVPAEPRARTALEWLVRSGHLVVHQRPSGKRAGTGRFATYRVTANRDFTAADLTRARKAKSKDEAVRQARKSPPPLALQPAPPDQPHTHAKQWDDERTLRMDIEAPPRTEPSVLDKHEGCERALHAQAMDYEQRLTDQAHTHQKALRDLQERLADSEALVRAVLDKPETADLIRRAMRVARERPV